MRYLDLQNRIRLQRKIDFELLHCPRIARQLFVKARAHVYVTGRVQGVFFRAETAEVANRLGLRGWVKNLHDGRVEAVFEGEKDGVEKAVEFCRRGPAGAYVQNVEVKWEDTEGKFPDFRIRR